MTKLCKTCRSSRVGFKLDIENSRLTEAIYMCKNIKFKRMMRDKGIEDGLQNAKDLTDTMLKKYAMSTDSVTTECKFYQPKESI